MNAVPRLSIGLAVYNGERFLTESIESLLGQTYEDFELIISDNASTDGTEDICHTYAKQDARIRYFRQPHNIGSAPNHNFTIHQARGELFKTASHDDLYGRDLLKLCVDALDRWPDVVLAHSWSAAIDDSGNVTHVVDYPVNTAAPRAPERFRSMLFEGWGDDEGGVIRMSVLRKTPGPSRRRLVCTDRFTWFRNTCTSGAITRRKLGRALISVHAAPIWIRAARTGSGIQSPGFTASTSSRTCPPSTVRP
jgi:glycosyltransferase involved in cell wall biosynthesis